MTTDNAIVVLDDDLDCLNMTTTFLNLSELPCFAFARPQEAIDHISANPGIRLVIIDHYMPNLTGFAVAERLRALNNRDRGLFLVLLTGYLPDGHAAKQAALFDEILKKPVDPDALLQIASQR